MAKELKICAKFVPNIMDKKLMAYSKKTLLLSRSVGKYKELLCDKHKNMDFTGKCPLISIMIGILGI